MNPTALIMNLLKESGVVPPGFVGQVVLNIGRGEHLCSVERMEKKELTSGLQGMNHANFTRLIREFGE
jgi:hypothetical protein